MCPPTDKFHCVAGDDYMGHKLVADAFARYISHSPSLHCYPFRYPVPSLPPPEPLDIYIARSIHFCEVPEIVPYAACYLLISISQPCQCRTPHDDDHSDDTLSSPSRFSHILSRAVTRTPFSKSRWSDRHIFVGAFYLALATYKNVLINKHKKQLPCWNRLHLIFGVCQREIMEIVVAIRPYISLELEAAVKSMMEGDYVRDILEVDCPFVLAGRKRSLKAEEAKAERQNRKISLNVNVESMDHLVRKLQRKPIRIL